MTQAELLKTTKKSLHWIEDIASIESLVVVRYPLDVEPGEDKDALLKEVLENVAGLLEESELCILASFIDSSNKAAMIVGEKT